MSVVTVLHGIVCCCCLCLLLLYYMLLLFMSCYCTTWYSMLLLFMSVVTVRLWGGRGLLHFIVLFVTVVSGVFCCCSMSDRSHPLPWCFLQTACVFVQCVHRQRPPTTLMLCYRQHVCLCSVSTDRDLPLPWCFVTDSMCVCAVCPQTETSHYPDALLQTACVFVQCVHRQRPPTTLMLSLRPKTLWWTLWTTWRLDATWTGE